MCTHLLLPRVLLRFNKEGRFNEAKDEYEPNKNKKKEDKDEPNLDSFPFLMLLTLLCLLFRL